MPYMFAELWNEFLYRPLFNFLIWMYNNWTEGNMGWAIVYLTIFLRLALLPFTIVAERNKIKNRVLVDEIKKIEKGYKKDPILKNQEIRRVLRDKKIKPWSSVVSLGVQLLVLLLLYQVFMRGITGERVKILRLLYDFVDYPGTINTLFYGFELNMTHDGLWAGLVMVFLLLYIYGEYHQYKVKLTKGDLAYFLLFPILSFLVLYYLPMVKSLFVLTSLAISVLIH
ncbi:MAG: hypothetical protein COU33_01650, partial [Candidatus Magasanikbacteria bacterium CG10_big_fil_rev_8_21_14_0_10_43_6]